MAHPVADFTQQSLALGATLQRRKPRFEANHFFSWRLLPFTRKPSAARNRSGLPGPIRERKTGETGPPRCTTYGPNQAQRFDSGCGKLWNPRCGGGGLPGKPAHPVGRSYLLFNSTAFLYLFLPITYVVFCRPPPAATHTQSALRCAPFVASVLLPLSLREPHPGPIFNFPVVSFSGFGSI
jgi:hypothetical protein